MTDDAWVFSDPHGDFNRNYNKKSFPFAHGLSGHPLFDLPHLVEYAGRLPENPELAYWSNGEVDVNDRWDSEEGHRYTLRDTIAHIEENNSLVLLKRIESDSTFGPLMRDIMARLASLSGAAMSEDIVLGRGTLLIASPRRITSYHMDSDTNFLFQITGDKLFSVFDQSDRTLTSELELERFFAGDMNGAKFKESRRNDAHAYDLKAGFGVHVPSTAPHWAQNADNVSIALSVNFDLYSMLRIAQIYRLNHRLRNLGLAPTPPGVSMWRDRFKFASAKGLAATRKLIPMRR